jgi:hypothetical protein
VHACGELNIDHRGLEALSVLGDQNSTLWDATLISPAQDGNQAQSNSQTVAISFLIID